jgi:hypothetical protein
MMMSVATSPERLAVEDAIMEHQCEVINSDILDITWLNELCETTGNDMPKTRTLTAILLEMGYEQIEKKRVKVSKTGRYHYVWIGAQYSGDIAPQEVVRNFHDGACPF